MVRIAFSSISRWSASTVASAAITRWASAVSRLTSASTDSATRRSASPPISARRDEISRRSSSKALRICSVIELFLSADGRENSAEASRDVIERPLVGRVGEDVLGGSFLDQDAEMEEGGALRDARGL